MTTTVETKAALARIEIQRLLLFMKVKNIFFGFIDKDGKQFGGGLIVDFTNTIITLKEPHILHPAGKHNSVFISDLGALAFYPDEEALKDAFLAEHNNKGNLKLVWDFCKHNDISMLTPAKVIGFERVSADFLNEKNEYGRKKTLLVPIKQMWEGKNDNA